MYANYHTHTSRCNHAVGMAEDYIAEAIKNGYTKLGFSDHAPYIFHIDGYYSHFRMQVDELPEYVAEINAAKKKYAGQIELFCGVEIEYYPDLFGETLEYLRSCGTEYMILGQHFTGNGTDGMHTYSREITEKELTEYCDQCIAAMETGLFSCIAHPDIIRFSGDDRIYTKHISRLCAKASRLGIPLEINLLGLRERRDYPRRRFWEIAAAEGCTACLGCDAHSPDVFCDTAAEKQARILAESVGITLAEDIKLIKI